jgi:hypothetical protein
MRRLLMIQDLYKQKRSLEIDDKVKQVITDIKLEEAKIAHRQNSVEGAAPQVSVAT